jgi:hypothetical protein
MEQSPLLLRPFIGLLHQSWMLEGDDCGAISGMNDGQGKPKYPVETYAIPLCPPQMSHDFTSLEPGPPRWKAGD